MSVEVTSEELNAVLLDEEVQALIVQKLSVKKTEGLAAALTAQYKSLGIEPATDEPASTGDSGAEKVSEDAADGSADTAS